MNCADIQKSIGCYRDAGGITIGTVEIHTEYRRNAAGNPVVHAVRYTNADGVPILLGVGETVTPGACVVQTSTRPVCATMVNTEVWNVEERIDEIGNITYWDVDVSPMVDVTANVASVLNGGECPCTAVAAPIDTPLATTFQRLAVPYTVVTGYKSVSVTAISSDVTIDAVPVPASFNWSVDSSSGERFSDTVAITGTDYIVTEVR